MTTLTRRHVLSGAAAASAATALTSLAGSPASAAAPLATAQAPGWYRYNVGSYQITVATDGKRSFKLPDSFVLNAKKDQVNEALLAAHMEKDMMTIPYSPIGSIPGRSSSSSTPASAKPTSTAARASAVSFSRT
jgi:hypothetical protein